MLAILIKVVFTLIAKIGDLILFPIVTLVSQFIPSFSNFYTYMLNYIDIIFSKFTFVFKLFCIPPECLQALLIVATSSLAIAVGCRTYVLVMNIYERFKP